MEGARLGKWLAVLLAVVAPAALAGCSDDEDGNPGGGGDGGSGGSGGSGGMPEGIAVEGLSAPVQVSFDDRGVLHASCMTDEDCATTLGYFHAAQRFFQMDIQRRAARGQLASLIPTELGSAVFLRHFFTTRDGQPIEEAIWAMLDADTKAYVEAYTRGVNAWLADLRAGRNGATLTEEYDVSVVPGDPDQIPDWDPLDSVAFARLMTWQLSESSDVELNLGPIFAAEGIDLAVFADLFTLRPGEPSYTIDASGATYPPAPAMLPRDMVLAGVRDRLEKAREALASARDVDLGLFARPPFGESGSNNWVVAPERTRDGNALLANDPHLSLSNPPVWYFVELDSTSREGATGTIHAAGGSFPGIPGVPIGHNENLAWGNTVAYYDVTDVYVETLSEDGTKVLFNGTEVPIVTREFTFPVAGQADVTRTLKWVPHHGPIVAEDLPSRTAISVRWTGHEPTLELQAFYDLAKAGSIAEGQAALEDFGVGAQNTVMIDAEGNIGWYPMADVPVRPWASASLPPWLPLPGDGSAEWDGYVPREELPQLTKPPAGFIATANQAMTDAVADGDPTNETYPVLQDYVAPGFRHARVVELLEEGGNAHTVETMHAIQADVQSLVGRRIVPHLLGAAAASPGDVTENGQKVVQALADWTAYTCPTGLAGPRPDSPPSTDADEVRESRGCTAFHFALVELYRAAFLDEFRTAGINTLGRIPQGNNQMARVAVILLERPDELGTAAEIWDDDSTEEVETRDEILRKALDAAGQALVARVGEPEAWRWGKLHTVTFGSQLSLLNPALDDGPWANDGGLFTVDVANPPADGTRWSHGSGASLRLVAEAKDGRIHSFLQLPGGQDLHRDGPHYGDLIDEWLANESFAVPFTREEADAAAVDEVTLVP